MSHNDRWFLIIVGTVVGLAGGALLLGIIAGLGGFIGDGWFQVVVSLIGAAAGALAGMWGAIKVEDYKRLAQQRIDLNAIENAIERIELACSVMVEWQAQPGTPQCHVLRWFADGAEILSFKMHRAEIYDEELWVRLIEIEDIATLPRVRARTLARHEMLLDENDYQQFRSVADHLLPVINSVWTVIKAMPGPRDHAASPPNSPMPPIEDAPVE